MTIIDHRLDRTVAASKVKPPQVSLRRLLDAMARKKIATAPLSVPRSLSREEAVEAGDDRYHQIVIDA